MDPLVPSHYKPVTALANLSNSLVSGCSEYLLRTWDYAAGREKCAEQKREASLKAVHSEGEEMYTGGTNGHIRIWQIVRERLLDMIDLDAHAQAVNGIAWIKSNACKAFASAGDDKAVKVWRYSA